VEHGGQYPAVRANGLPRPAARRLTVLTGPTAVGKGTVAADIRARYPEVWLSVSVTTRRPRPGERDGEHYSFVDEAKFDAMIAAGEFLEWAVVHGRHRYGTPRRPVEEALANGRPALLEIDLQGARQVRRSMPGALFVFLAPPSWDELVRRLAGRGTESPEEQRRRLETARTEIGAARKAEEDRRRIEAARTELASAQAQLKAEPEFDVTIVNDDVHRATDELVQCMGLVPRPLGVARG
jgi:guanylate kinase